MEHTNAKGQSLTMAAFVMVMILTGVASIVDAGNSRPHGHHHHSKHHHSTPAHPATDAGQLPVGTTSSKHEEKLGLFGPQLNENYYAFTCPLLKYEVSNVVESLIRHDITLPAAWLRLHFHDCFVHGCDASVLINGTDPNSEINALPNKGSLRGLNEFETIKTAVEKLCPGVVSCADLLALVARDSINTISSAYWNVPLGRRDGLVSSAADADAALPSPFFTYSQLVTNFAAVGLTAKDMVVLSGAHTIGFAHCAVVQGRLFNFSGAANGVDPTLNQAYAAKLQVECPLSSPGTLIPLDPTGDSQTFDSQYFTNVVSNKGLLPSDAALITDGTGSAYTHNEAGNIFTPNIPFFYDFGQSMEKMGQINVLTGNQGEIRKTCRAFNTPTTS